MAPSPPLAKTPNAAIVPALRKAARALGFARCGVANVTPLARGREALRRWLDRGAAGAMTYMASDPDRRADPRSLLPEARSAIVVAATYARPGSLDPSPAPHEGRLARYARGADYHHVLRKALAALAAWLDSHIRDDLVHRICVDTSPLLERELAVAAGLGFIGKNTLLVTPGLGSYTLLGVLLTSAPIAPDTPASSSSSPCGRCTRCIDACPTAALEPEGYVLDARRCVSYLTIERRGVLGDIDDPDDSLRRGLGTWVFGCDICQEVCPHNTHAKVGPRAPEPVPIDPRLDAECHPASLDLAALLTQGSGAYRRLVRGRALARASRPHLARNAALVAGNQRHAGAHDDRVEDALAKAETSERPELRDAAAWARRNT